MELDLYSPKSGRILQEDNSYINEADYLAPGPNGDQIIVRNSAGVLAALSPPNLGNIKADIFSPVEMWVRFGATPAVNAGIYFAPNETCELENAVWKYLS